jgi:hypothetical protein
MAGMEAKTGFGTVYQCLAKHFPCDLIQLEAKEEEKERRVEIVWQLCERTSLKVEL